MLHGPPPGTPSLCRCPSRKMGQGVHMQECNLAGPQGRGLRRVGSIWLVGQMSHFSLCQGLASHALERGAHSTPRTFAEVLRTGISMQQQCQDNPVLCGCHDSSSWVLSQSSSTHRLKNSLTFLRIDQRQGWEFPLFVCRSNSDLWRRLTICVWVAKPLLAAAAAA